MGEGGFAPPISPPPSHGYAPASSILLSFLNTFAEVPSWNFISFNFQKQSETQQNAFSKKCKQLSIVRFWRKKYLQKTLNNNHVIAYFLTSFLTFLFKFFGDTNVSCIIITMRFIII